MPKVIANLRERILGEAKAELLKCGYEALAIRTIAASCGIAVGTVYNYFSSKSMLAAAVMLDDWLKAVDELEQRSNTAGNLREGLAAVHDAVAVFYDIYRSVWANYTFSDSERNNYGKRHKMLVRQLGDVVSPLLARFAPFAPAGADIFIAENILLCVGGSDMSFDTFLNIAERIIR